VQSLRIAVLATIAFASISCSTYRLAGSGHEQQATIAIVTLENDSVEPGVEVVVTRALRQGFLRRGSARLVSDPRQAEFVIRGKVLPLDTLSTSFSTVALAIEYTVRMELKLDMEASDGEVVPIQQEALRESELYLASADVEAARKNRQEALRHIADVLAARVHDALDLYFEERAAALSEELLEETSEEPS
jgi:hypothetical protein